MKRNRDFEMNSTMRKAIELIQEPELRIQRNVYSFVIQTKYLMESQIFAEAYLRGLVTGRVNEVITRNQRRIIDEQLLTDHQRWTSSGVDLTPIVMDFRATPNEASIIINEVVTEIQRLEESGADIAAIGAQIEFGINVLKRTNWTGLNNVETLQEALDCLNEKYSELVLLHHPVPTNSINETRQTETSHTQFFTPINRSSFNRPQLRVNGQTYNVSQHQEVPQAQPTNVHRECQSTMMNQNCGNGRNTMRANNPQRNISTGNLSQNSILSGRQDSVLIGPHRVSSTIINLISKNVYETSMDAIDQIETWESQAKMLQVPIDYFLSYMEVLLSKEIQSWWQLNRSKLNNWQSFRSQFIEDFGDNNRAIKAEQALANLAQGDNESFQQLFLRFTQLMKHIKPEKSPSDMLYSLKSSLKPELRTACLNAQTIAELKKMSQDFEGMEKVNMARNRQYRSNKVNAIEDHSAMEVDEKTVDYWNNEVNWNDMTEDEDRTFVIEENLEKRKTAMSQRWTKEQKKEWLTKQLCFNCDVQGHLQGQCDKTWKPHCPKCGNKNANNTRDCVNCAGNASSSTQTGAQH